MDRTAEQLNAIIRHKYQILDEAGTITISPSDLALEVYKEIDPSAQSPALVEFAALLELRQLARAVCRQRQADSERDAEQVGLFEFQLQDRYPAQRNLGDGHSEDVYVLRPYLTVEERWKNINRLNREARSKIAHADALKAETESLVRSGQLQEIAISNA